MAPPRDQYPSVSPLEGLAFQSPEGATSPFVKMRVGRINVRGNSSAQAFPGDKMVITKGGNKIGKA